MSDSLETYSPLLDRDLEDVQVLDLGDVPLDGVPMGVALARIADAMQAAATLGALAVMLGGEHTGSLGGYRGLKRVHPDAFLVQIDAHLDIREEYEGRPLTHASWVFHAGQEFGFDRVVQLGVRSGERAEWRRARGLTALTTHDLSLPDDVRRLIGATPVYLSIDIDVLDPAHAPGTGCPEPGGPTFQQLEAFLHSFRGLRVVGFDVMEVAPNLDPSNITAACAAKLVREAVLLFGGG